MSPRDLLQGWLESLKLILTFRPRLSVLILISSLVAAVLEGIGISFIVPIVETVQQGGMSGDQGGIQGMFFDIFAFLNVPFTLEFLIFGLVGVMVVRYSASFAVAWLRAELRTQYIRHLQLKAFERTLGARISVFDVRGSDEVLNTIVKETFYAGRAIKWIVLLFEQLLLSALYILIAFYLAPWLTITAAVLFGGVGYLVRNVVETGYDVGDRVADANERIQRLVQGGTQGIRTVKLFGIQDDLYDEFTGAANSFKNSTMTLRRNQAFISSLNNLLSAVMVFLFIYLLIRFSSLSFSEFALFLFAMFRLAPRVSTLNKYLYQAEGDLPHVARAKEFIEDLTDERETDEGTTPTPAQIDRISFEDVSFTYRGQETIFDEFDIDIEGGTFVALVGPSGAGKSTVVSLLTRFYDPDSGTIRVNGTPIDEFELGKWRSELAVVRQQPFIFNDTLRYNLTLGRPDATDAEIRHACDVAKIDEFLADLTEGLDTELGDDGVQLSGGQRQRVALGRALLKDAKILVLDEATSDLDSDLETQIQSKIEGMDEQYTVIAIAHRLSTVKNADRIYVIEDGQISERGAHGDLVENEGTYADLYSTQVRG